eukprot:GEMP01080884.1.p1 GENE.GEMP01080884.1~~GEMP01080884.1.p1  ORF type:complete len:134 (+),score=20.58 GEMP01080884.1:58-402(+)
MVTNVKAEIDQLLKEYPLLVIEKLSCPHCKKAKEALESVVGSSNPKYKVIDISTAEYQQDEKMNKIQDYMLEITRGRTVPRVFIGGKCIGGGSETVALKKDGKLEALLQEVGVI